MTFQAVARRHRCPDCTGANRLRTSRSSQDEVANRSEKLAGVVRTERRNAVTGTFDPERRESGARRSVVPSLIVAAFVLALAFLEGAVPRLAAWVASWL